MSSRAPLHAQAEQPGVESRVAHVHHRATAGRFAIQPVHASTMRHHVGQQAQFPQHLQTGGLQQEAGADGSEFRGTLEHLHAVAVARQQQGRRLAGGAVADDRDVLGVHGARTSFVVR